MTTTAVFHRQFLTVKIIFYLFHKFHKIIIFFLLFEQAFTLKVLNAVFNFNENA